MNYAGKNYSKIHNQFLKLGKDVYGDADDRKSLIQECIDFEKNLGIQIGAENISFQCENEFKLINSKLLLKEKKCVILGRTSSGKSTLINALLTEELLPAKFGSTSNCFFEIKARPDNKNYLVVNNEERNIEELKDLNNLTSGRHLENGSHITMYYDKSKCQLLKDDIVIIDTPGYDSGIFDNNLMKGYFDDADIVVLVVSALTGINKWDKALVENFKTTLAQLNFVILYNFWDVVQPTDSDGTVKAQSIARAKNILCDILNIDFTQADSSIFFVSASERINNFTNKDAVNTTSFVDERNESFARFFDYLEMKMSESLSKKKNNCLQKLKLILKSGLDQCQNCISQMIDKRPDLEQDIKIKLETIRIFQEDIYPAISKLFNNSFERFLIKALDLFKKDAMKFAERIPYMLTKDFFGIFSFNISRNYHELFEEITKENFKNLKDLEKNYRNKDISPFQQNILNEIYFPFFNFNNKINSINIEAFEENFKKIIRVIIVCAAVTSGLIVLISSIAAAKVARALCVAEVSVAGSVAANNVAADSVIFGGTGGWISGIILSYFGIKAFQLPFRFAWKSEEAAIRNLWNMSELDQMKDCSTFINYTIADVEKLIKSIDEKASKIQNDLDNIDE